MSGRLRVSLLIVCVFLAVSSLLSFGYVESRIVSLSLNFSAVLVQGGMTGEIFLQLWSC
jgi:hypothetical protein